MSLEEVERLFGAPSQKSCERRRCRLHYWENDGIVIEVGFYSGTAAVVIVSDQRPGGMDEVVHLHPQPTLFQQTLSWLRQV
jgi:hypothetical protein